MTTGRTELLRVATQDRLHQPYRQVLFPAMVKLFDAALQTIADATERELKRKQIAHDLGITERTIKLHRGQIMRKMGAESLADLVRHQRSSVLLLLSYRRRSPQIRENLS